jgi:TfoX/Sxy family transcriptional regulator of competence genes
MAYNERLADRVREALADVPNVEEKKMFSGVAFMVNDKMCITVGPYEMMCRIGAKNAEKCLEDSSCRQTIMRGKVMKDFVHVADEGMRTQKDFDRWISLALAFNREAKQAPKKKKKTDQ